MKEGHSLSNVVNIYFSRDAIYEAHPHDIQDDDGFLPGKLFRHTITLNMISKLCKTFHNGEVDEETINEDIELIYNIKSDSSFAEKIEKVFELHEKEGYELSVICDSLREKEVGEMGEMDEMELVKLVPDEDALE